MPKQSSSSSVRSGSTLRVREDDRSTIRDPSPPPHDDEDDASDDAGHLSSEDYAAQRDMILSDDDDQDEDEDDQEFLYPGADVSTSEDYTAQMADALGDAADELDASEEQEVEAEPKASWLNTSSTATDHDEISLDGSSVAASPPATRPTITTKITRPSLTPSSSRATPTRPFLHPSISRLRSVTPQIHISSSSSVASYATSHARGGLSPSPSHFSSISRASSVSDLRNASEATTNDDPERSRTLPSPLEAFRWTHLKIIGDYMFHTTSQKASALLGSSWGTPTVMTANGLICIGTDQGLVVVFDFRQQFKHICGATETPSKPFGAVTALALSYDHTFLAVGYATGHINLFDLSRPQTPARSVPPTNMSVVSAGRKEGHIIGSAVTQLGFVGTRHTAIVSADDSGMAFYHSLGKVLFVEANDVLRLLGKYSDALAPPNSPGPSSPSSAEDFPQTPTTPTLASTAARKGTSGLPTVVKQKRAPGAILAMAALPLGPAPHTIDAYNLVALLTPVKLVVVGLRPTPRTWFRRHRATGMSEDAIGRESASTSRWRGCVAWFPSVTPNDGAAPSDKKKLPANGGPPPSLPMLAFSWGRVIRLLRAREEVVRQNVEDQKVGGGKRKIVEVGQVIFDEVRVWTTEDDALAIQWLNVTQLLVVTASHLEVFEVSSATAVERISFNADTLTSLPGPSQKAFRQRLAHSVRVYKGKLFLLGQHDVRVGTLLSWADRILAYVEEGDFLSAIDLTRGYYVGSAPGSKYGLPEDPVALSTLVGKKLHDLMVASAAYAFSEDRMTDRTHITPEGRGVDRTPLFEGLVDSCVNASLSLNDFDFLYDDLYDRYESSGITSIFLRRIEPFILDGSLRVVPPYVAQQIIAMHGEMGQYEKAERVIWHLDPMNLDSNQAIKLCQQYELYDGLIYVYTRTLQDFVSPIVELLGLIRKVRQQTHASSKRLSTSSDTDSVESSDSLIDRLVPNAYKAYSYLSSVLSGLTYPSEEPLPAELGSRAKKEVYQFLFSGHSTFWPPGPSGKLVLTAAEGDNGTEPTHPYLRLLLRFDAEAFLHALDIAFEDAYLNDSPQGISRQAIVNVLLKIIPPYDTSAHDLTATDITFTRIFIARNVPKYPQFIEIAPTAQQNLLLGLADDPDSSTTEDRQLAAEFLLSVYTPHNRDDLLKRFDKAGFFRILRTWYRHDRDWSPLIDTYVRDPDNRPEEVFANIDKILLAASRANKGVLPPDVASTAVDAIPQLLASSTTATASLLDKHMPGQHSIALTLLGAQEPFKQYVYLRSLIEPGALGDEPNFMAHAPRRAVSYNLEHGLRGQYIRLMCLYNSGDIVALIEKVPRTYFDPDEVVQEAEVARIYDVAVWMTDREGKTLDAFAKLDAAGKTIASDLTQWLSSNGPKQDFQNLLESAQALFRMGVRLCRQHAQHTTSQGEFSPEDLWFKLLQSQIEAVQYVASAAPNSTPGNNETLPLHTECLDGLRDLLRDTFSDFISQSSSHELSFPRLFKRLVDSTAGSRNSSRGFYTEFRLILTGMLESYRFEGDFLTLNNRLVKQDLYETLVESVRFRSRGWRPKAPVCSTCQMPLKLPSKSDQNADLITNKPQIAIFRSGALYHADCLPTSPISIP